MNAVSTEADAPMRASPRKVETVDRLTHQLSRATSAIVTDYRGLTVAQLSDLRGRLRADEIEYVVVKNTLARRAAEAAGMGQFSSVLVGPVGLALGYGELARPARILTEYFRQNRRLPVVAGLVEGRVIDADGVRQLSELPPREVLLSMLAGTIQSPLTTLAGALQSILSTFAATLDAYREKLEAGRQA